MRNQKGNILVISIIFIAMILIIFIFVLGIFVSHINSILYNLKLDMYSMNRSAIISVNKNKANIDYFSYDKKSYQNEFTKVLKQNYKLKEDLTNPEKLITSIKIKEYTIYEKGKKDNYTNKKCDDRVIHTVLEVKIKPIILASFFEDIFTFTIHEDVNINLMKVER